MPLLSASMLLIHAGDVDSPISFMTWKGTLVKRSDSIDRDREPVPVTSLLLFLDMPLPFLRETEQEIRFPLALWFTFFIYSILIKR